MTEVSDPLNSQLVSIDIRTLLKLNSLGVDCVAVYMFYIQCAKIQATSKIWSNNSFVKGGIRGISRERIQEVNKILEENGMISRKQEFKGRGNIGKNYIKLNFLIINPEKLSYDGLSVDDISADDISADDNPSAKCLLKKRNASQEKEMLPKGLRVPHPPMLSGEPRASGLREYGDSRINAVIAVVQEVAGMPPQSYKHRIFISNWIKNMEKARPGSDPVEKIRQVLEHCKRINHKWHSPKICNMQHMASNWQEIALIQPVS